MIENLTGRKARATPQEEPAALPPQAKEGESASTVSAETAAPNMVTINRDAAERFMLALEQCLGDLEEQKEQVEALLSDRNVFQSATIAKFNALAETMQELSKRIAATDSYEAFLEERVKSANLDAQVGLLEQQLQKEKAEISEFIIRTESFITLKIESMAKTVEQLRSNNEAIESCLNKLEGEIRGKVEKVIIRTDEKIEEASESFMKGSKNQYESLKADSRDLIEQYTEKCREHLETVQKQSVSFLKQCAEQNKRLIEKVPAAADGKISKKDVLLAAISSLAVASLLANIFM